jgi:hypothetical protein
MVLQETSAEAHVAIVEHESLVRCESPHMTVEVHREGGAPGHTPAVLGLAGASKAEAARGQQIRRLGDP